MVGRKRGDIPQSLVRGRDRFEAWRLSRKVGARIPDKLWSLAVTLAEAHGLSRTASALKLDYHGLKNRVAGGVADGDRVPVAVLHCIAAFVYRAIVRRRAVSKIESSSFRRKITHALG